MSTIYESFRTRDAKTYFPSDRAIRTDVKVSSPSSSLGRTKGLKILSTSSSLGRTKGTKSSSLQESRVLKSASAITLHSLHGLRRPCSQISLPPQSLQRLLRRWCLHRPLPPQSLHELLCRWCSQMLLPPQSLHDVLRRWCSQMPLPPQSLHCSLLRLCSHKRLPPPPCVVRARFVVDSNASVSSISASPSIASWSATLLLPPPLGMGRARFVVDSNAVSVSSTSARARSTSRAADMICDTRHCSRSSLHAMDC